MLDARSQRRRAVLPVGRRTAALLFTGLLTLSLAAPVQASSTTGGTAGTTTVTTATTADTAASMAASILASMNQDRAAMGLRPYRSWAPLATIATQRAVRMAATGVLSHQVAGDPGAQLTAAGIPWYGFGEDIGVTSYAWGADAAANLYTMWQNSPTHAAIMYSSTYNYIGIGIVQAANGATWASMIFTQSPDHTRPVAYNGALTRYGSALHFTWSGHDPLLQTLTAGIRGFYVQYRMDSGSWITLRSNSLSTRLWLYGRPHRHYYSFRVRVADRRGNLSAWTAPKRIWLP